MRRLCGTLFSAMAVLFLSCQNPVVNHPQITEPEVVGSKSVISWPILGEEDKGTNVDALQYLLAHAGYSFGQEGDFEGVTAESVINFQRKSGLEANGMVSGTTWEKLVVQVQKGSTGDAVKALQVLLRYKYDFGSVAVNGQFDEATEWALSQFKTMQGLTGGAIVGLTTWKYLLGCPADESGRAGGRWSISVSLPQNRYKYGTLRLYDNRGKVILTASCLGRSVSNASMYVRNGNTPTGKYTGYLYGPVSPRVSYGPYKVVAMNGVSGIIVASGRSGIWIHGGRSQSSLSPTHGCVRVFESTQLAIQNKIRALVAKGVPSTGIINITQY